MSGLNELALDLGRAGLRAIPKIHVVAEEAGKKIEADAREMAPGAHGGAAKHYPKSITHEVEITGKSIDAVIGPDKHRKQGPLGNLFEYGSVNNPPLAHLGPALDRTSPWFEEAVVEAAARSAL
jgi:hypothetical protein